MKLAPWAAILGIALLFAACSRPQPPPVEQTWLTMGTFASVTLRGDDAEHLARYHEETARCFDALNKALSVYLPDSEISQLNGSTGMVSVSKQTFAMLEETARYATLTEGAFDPTVSPLIKAWGFSGGTIPTALPSAETMTRALAQTGYRHLKLSPYPATPATPPSHHFWLDLTIPVWALI